jgi:hypothetical protein
MYIIKISHALFQGFTLYTESDDIEEGLAMIKKTLLDSLTMLHLDVLADKAKYLHLHMNTMEKGIINWACDHH